MERPLLKQSNTEWPRITLVTPVLNGARYIEQAIRSVISQGYPNLEYFIVDGGSSDGTLDTIRKYEGHISWWASEPDRGMYDGLNKGFLRSSGNIMGWISATDMLHVGSLFVVGSVFRTFPEVEWITGLPTFFNGEGMAVRVGRLPRWSRLRFLAAANQYLELGSTGIQQESTFWRRSLWERSGGYLDASRKYESDFELWVRFFRHASLYSVSALIGGYRGHSDSAGTRYKDEMRNGYESIINAELGSMRGGELIKIFRRVNGVIEDVPKVRVIWWRLFLKLLYRLPGPDLAPLITLSDEQRWVMPARFRKSEPVST